MFVCQWQKQYLNGEILETQLNYWKENKQNFMRISDLYSKLSEEVASKSYSKNSVLECMSRCYDSPDIANRLVLA